MSSGKAEKPESVGVRPRSGGRLARRARSFKEDLLERFIQMRSPSSTRSASPHKTMHPRMKSESPLQGLGCENHTEKTTPEMDVLNLKKQVENALRYFQDVIDKKTSILPQSASVVLETVLAIHSALQNHLTDEQSSLLVSSYNQVYQSLANLVKWADVVLIHGEKALDRDTLTEVVTMVRSAVKTLVDLVIEKLRNKELNNGFSPVTNGRVAPINECMRNNRADSVDVFPHPTENLKLTRPGFPGASSLGHSISSDSILSSCTQNHLDHSDVPPPKPPLLTNGVDFSRHKAWNGGITCSSVPDIGPPALPPKKRFNPNASCRWNHSASSTDGSNGRERLALSAGSSRDSGEWLTACTGSSRRVISGSDWSSSINHSPSSLSPRSVSASSLDSTLNQSSDELLSSSTLPVSKPEFEFAHTSMAFHCHQASSRSTMVSWTATRSTDSAVDLIQNRLNNLSFEEVSSGIFSSSSSRSDVNSMSSLTTNATTNSTSLTASPPAIPPKRRENGRPRTNSQYDNVPDPSVFLNQNVQQDLVVSNEMSGLKLGRRVTIADGLCISPSALHSQSMFDAEPPPLPPKKKNVMAYMQIFGSYVDSRTINFSLPSCSAAYEMTMHREMSMSRSVTTSTLGFMSDSFEKPTMMINGFPDVDRLSDNNIITSSPPALPPKKARVTTSTGQYEYLPALPSSELNNGTAATNHCKEKLPLDTNNYQRHSNFEANNGGDHLQGTDEQNSEIGSKMLDEIDARPHLILKNEGEEGPQIRGGSVDALLVHSSAAPNAEILYRDAFMTTYRTFISPVDLVNKLLYRYNKFGHVTDVTRQRVARNTFSLLVCVVGDFGVGDMSEELLQILSNFGYRLLCNGELALARALRKKVLEKWNAKVNCAAAMAPLSSKGVFTKQSHLVDFKSEQLAEQMTLLDADLFQKIEIPEVLVWSRLQKEELSPNLTAFTEHFNKMSYWARSRILECDDAKDRERYVIKFIKIMKHLRKINNFNSYLAILSAIDSAPIRRLEWQKHITEGLKEYCELIDSSSSFRAYRQALSETEPPCIPYIGLILQDLTFVHIGNSDFLQEGSVNFVKRWQQFNILDTMRRFRKCQYNFKPCDRIIAFFNHFDNHLCEEAMWQISEQIKPRPKKVEQAGQQNKH